jgi:stearoyl-CoA desaturase (Delta-9 desaturase)
MANSNPSTAMSPVSWRRTLRAWLDNQAIVETPSDARRIEWLRTLPFVGVHLGCLGALWVGWSMTAVLVAVGLYALRMLAITGFYHRYFAHRAFHTSRALQFMFALLGATAVQRGPLWWASHHRHHHAHSDDPTDAHSPHQHGFVWSHLGWFMTRENFRTRLELVEDLVRFPELRFLDRFDALLPLALAGILFGVGALLERYAPGLGTSGWQLLVWGFCISTVVLYHATFSVNSLAHTIGRRRYATHDQSRNNWWLAIFTFGEGWHNNHHHFPGSARQGFYWWEIDITYYVLRALAAVGLVWNLRAVPVRIRDARRVER